MKRRDFCATELRLEVLFTLVIEDTSWIFAPDPASPIRPIEDSGEWNDDPGAGL